MRDREEELNEGTFLISTKNEVKRFGDLLEKRGLINTVYIEYSYIKKFWLIKSKLKTTIVKISDENLIMYYFKDTKEIGIRFSDPLEFKKIKKYPVESSLTKDASLDLDLPYFLKFQLRELVSIYW